MRITQVIQRMKQISTKLSSNIYASVQDQNNPYHLSFLRQLQNERKKEEHLDQLLKNLQVVVFDLETTGFFPNKGDHILSIGAIKVHGNHVQDDHNFYSLVHSSKKLSSEIVQLTGITNEELQSAPPLSEVLLQFFEFMSNEVLVAHHAAHERAFMQHVTREVMKTSFSQRIIDTSFLIRAVEPHFQLVSLEDCCSHCGIEVKNRHHALEDARMAANLWSYYLKKNQDLGFETLRDVYDQLAKMA